MNVKVKLICRAEDRHVADIELGPEANLDAMTIREGLSILDWNRCPPLSVILDGVQLTCGHCYEPLFFKGEEEELKAAMPSSVKVTKS